MIDQLISNSGTQFAELDKNKNCSFCGLCNILMDINILPEKRCAGIIKLKSIFDDCFCCKCLNDCCKSPCDCFKCSCSCPCKNAFAFVIFMIITIAVKFYCLLKNKSMLL